MSGRSLPELYAVATRVPLFAVFMRPTDRYDPETDEGRELMRAHLEWLLEMEIEGRLFAAGPLDYGQPPRTGDPIVNATGMYLFAAASGTEAAAIAAREPFAVAGWRTWSLCPWLLNEGAGADTARRIAKDFG